MSLRAISMGFSALALFGMSAAAAPSENGNTGNPTAAVVRMEGDSFKPNTVEIRRGEAVVWKNTSLATHTVTDDPAAARSPDDAALPDGAKAFDSGPIGIGGTYSHRFEVPGVYRYFCTLHEAEGMVGTVIVRR